MAALELSSSSDDDLYDNFSKYKAATRRKPTAPAVAKPAPGTQPLLRPDLAQLGVKAELT